MEDREPIICPDCGGTGSHPWMNAFCKRCGGPGELDGEAYDDRYTITRYRAASGCFDY